MVNVRVILNAVPHRLAVMQTVIRATLLTATALTVLTACGPDKQAAPAQTPAELPTQTEWARAGRPKGQHIGEARAREVEVCVDRARREAKAVDRLGRERRAARRQRWRCWLRSTPGSRRR